VAWAAAEEEWEVWVGRTDSKGLCKKKLAFWRPNLGQIWPLLIEQNRRNSIDYFEDFAIEKRVKMP